MIVYKVTNKVDGKVYIGRTTQRLSKRKSGHKAAAFKRNERSYFYQSIRQHGWDSFMWEVIEEHTDIEALNAAEMRWITEYNSTDQNYGYNTSIGGEAGGLGVVKDDEAKRKQGASRRKKDYRFAPLYVPKCNYNSRPGSTNPNAKLDEEKVREIKRLFATTDLTDQEISEMYGVSRPAINYIRVGHTWSHIKLVG
jgi:group I intron endonuclease